MNNKGWKEILKKSFGKEKDDRYHAIAMLTIYGIFFLILIFIIRIGGSSIPSNSLNNSNSTSTPSPTEMPSSDTNIEENNQNIIENDINYSYSYTITYNGISEVYLGKKIDSKEKFTLIKEGITTEYAILNDNYLILENGVYHITENPSKYFKYCDVEKILLLTENEISVESDNTIKYNISNSNLANMFKDNISIDNNKTNLIKMHIIDSNLKSIDLDFSNYLSSIDNENVTLTIHMEFVDVGKTDDFEIKVS